MDEEEKRKTLETFEKIVDAKFETDELIDKVDELIEECEVAIKEGEE